MSSLRLCQPDDTYPRLTANRKTGVTLQDTGIRDEHGLEPLDGIFSSPEKSPVKRNGVNHNSTIEEEEDMDIGHSMANVKTFEHSSNIYTGTIPDPTEVLSARRNGKPILPPPKARSPIKTTLNSSPRRSVGPMSPPSRRDHDSPARAASHPLANRKLDFSMEKLRYSIESSPQKNRSVFSLSSESKSGKARSIAGKGKKRPFDLRAGDGERQEDEDDEEEDEEGEDEQREGENNIIDRPVAAMDDGDLFDESGAALNGSDSLHPNGEDKSNIDDDTLPPEMVVQPRRKAGRPPRKPFIAPAHPIPVGLEAKSASTVENKKSGRRSKATLAGSDENRASNTEIEPFEEPASVDADESVIAKERVKPRKAGRPKKPRSEANRDEGEEGEAEPSKPAKRSKPTPIDATPAKPRRKGPKPPPSERNPNAKVTAAKSPRRKAKFAEPKLSMGAGHRPGPRSLFVLRSETPAEDNGARIMKSGRTSVKPLAFWRNERFVFGDVNIEGKNLLLPGIKEVIRTEEVVDPRPRAKRSTRRRALASKRRRLEDLEDEDEDEADQEAWELGEGILQAEVIQWDPTSRRGDEEQIEETGVFALALGMLNIHILIIVDLAYAPAAMQAATREVRGVDFRFTKTITLPFFGSGMVDLPPGGEKRVKNSRRMQMVFFMFYGRVTVNVAGTTFSIGKGGTWQVPRGRLTNPRSFLDHSLLSPRPRSLSPLIC